MMKTVKRIPNQSLAKIYLARQIALERGSLNISPRVKNKRRVST